MSYGNRPDNYIPQLMTLMQTGFISYFSGIFTFVFCFLLLLSERDFLCVALAAVLELTV